MINPNSIYRSPLVSKAIFGILALSMSGCVLMRADSAPLQQISEQQIRLSDDIKLSSNGWPQAQWWRRYNDDQLDALVTQALKDAPTMAVATARVQAGRDQTALAGATFGLQVGATASLDRQRVSQNGFLGPFAQTNPLMGTTGPWYTEGTVGLNAGYNFDLWGKDRAQVDAVLGIQNARLAEAAQSELLLSSQVVQTYFNTQSLYATLDLLKQARDIENEVMSAHEARVQRGLESQTQTEIARSHQLELDKQIIGVNSQMGMLREALRSLVGAGPDNLPVIKAQPLPDSTGRLPASLGYELLSRRPDLQAMHWYVQSSLKQVDVAKAAFYPSFDVKAFFGLDAIHIEDLTRSSSKQINVVPGLTLPIFDSGRLNAGLAVARSQSNMMIAQYNQSVLNAVREVAQFGIELEGLNQRALVENAELKAVAFSKESADAQYARGLIDRIADMEAKLPLLSEQGKTIELHNQQICIEVALTMALGGGYNSKTDEAITDIAGKTVANLK